MLEQREQNSTGIVFQLFPSCVQLVFQGCACLEKEAVNRYSAILLSWVVSPFFDPVLVIIK